MNRARKVDTNQKHLVNQLRKLGMSVAVTSSLGDGFPDLAIGWQGKTHLLEVKNPNLPPSRRKLTPDEQTFFSTWKGSVHKVETIDDILKTVNQ